MKYLFKTAELWLSKSKLKHTIEKSLYAYRVIQDDTLLALFENKKKKRKLP